jgi:hypothetical protein
MKRSTFEGLVAGALDAVLTPYGFSLTAQPPADVREAAPVAIFEADPVTFQERLPGLADRFADLSAVSCIDLTVRWERGLSLLSAEIEGFDLTELGAITDVAVPTGESPLDLQLKTLRATLTDILARLR